ncbi:MAG: hypothetical protein AABX95_02010 [Nanoarchaeota archaeon]
MTEKADWTKMKPADVEKIIVDLGKQKTPPAKIGLILRDQHGIPKARLLGLRIKKVLIKHKIHTDPEKDNLIKKIETLSKHFEKNHHDYTAMRKGVMYSAILRKKEKLQINNIQ